jgi:hypothetical protein
MPLLHLSAILRNMVGYRIFHMKILTLRTNKNLISRAWDCVRAGMLGFFLEEMHIYPMRLGGFYYLSHEVTRNQLIPCRNRSFLSTYPMIFGLGQVLAIQLQLSHVQIERCVTDTDVT